MRVSKIPNECVRVSKMPSECVRMSKMPNEGKIEYQKKVNVRI